jgi:hypothetical protein
MNTQELRQPQELPEQEQENADPKSPYATPMLVRLGNVKQVTEGMAVEFSPDNGGASF